MVCSWSDVPETEDGECQGGSATAFAIGQRSEGQCKTGSVEVARRSTGIAELALVVDGERVLLASHIYGPPAWALLGGISLPDEEPDAAARREVRRSQGSR